VLDLLRISVIYKTTGELLNDSRDLLGLTKQKTPGIRCDLAPVKTSNDVASPEGLKFKRLSATLCRHLAASLRFVETAGLCPFYAAGGSFVLSPGEKSGLGADVVICIHCGLDLRSKKQLGTKRESEPGVLDVPILPSVDLPTTGFIRDIVGTTAENLTKPMRYVWLFSGQMSNPAAQLFLLVLTIIPFLAIPVLAIPVAAFVVVSRLLFMAWNLIVCRIFTRYQAARNSQGNRGLTITTHFFNTLSRKRSVSLDVYRAMSYRYAEAGALSFFAVPILWILIGLAGFVLSASLLGIVVLLIKGLTSTVSGGTSGTAVICVLVSAPVLAAAATCLARLRLMQYTLVITLLPEQRGVRAFPMRFPQECVGLHEVRRLMSPVKELPVLSDSE